MAEETERKTAAVDAGIREIEGIGEDVELWSVWDRLVENFERAEAILARLEQEENGSQGQIRAVAELRQHIALAEKALATVTDAEAQRMFEETVLAALEAASPALRRKVIVELNERAGERGKGNETRWEEGKRVRGNGSGVNGEVEAEQPELHRHKGDLV